VIRWARACCAGLPATSRCSVLACSGRAVWAGLPRLQEALLAGDDEPAHAGLQVDDQPLQLVGGGQHLFGVPGAPFGLAQVKDRHQQHREGGADDQRQQAAGDHHAAGQPASRLGLPAANDPSRPNGAPVGRTLHRRPCGGDRRIGLRLGSAVDAPLGGPALRDHIATSAWTSLRHSMLRFLAGGRPPPAPTGIIAAAGASVTVTRGRRLAACSSSQDIAAATEVGPSVAEDRQVEPAEALGVGEDVGDNPPAPDREAEGDTRPAARRPHGSGDAVDECRSCEPGTPRERAASPSSRWPPGRCVRPLAATPHPARAPGFAPAHSQACSVLR
jgi:hypothetical protein